MRSSRGGTGVRGCYSVRHLADGDLIGRHSHVHAIVNEGLFKRDGFFIRIVKVDIERCAEGWWKRTLDLLLREEKIDEEVVRSMRGWPHSGFSIDNSVRLEVGDEEGMQRLVSYLSRCLFSLARMIKVTKARQVIYRAGQSRCVGFPNPEDERLREGLSRIEIKVLWSIPPLNHTFPFAL